jgi:endonuclease I
MRHLKKLFILVIWLSAFTLPGFCQIPEGYYDGTDGKTGDELKQLLYTIIKGHTEFPYTSSNSTDVWDIIKESDRDPVNPENVILIYSGLSVNAAQEYNNGNGWTREHVWAKVHGDFGTDPGPGTDLHHLRPECDEINNDRNSRWFAECTTPVYYNGANTGCFTSSDQWLWKPRKEVIGDVARMIFYMATRYEGKDGEPDLELIDYIPQDNNSKVPLFALLSDLLKWNSQDPVDDFERNRNEVIYNYQHNRNPFIDHPEFVELIWGTGMNTLTFTTSPDTIAIVGETYKYDIQVTDENINSEITVNLKSAPVWISINQTGNGTATLTGIPGDNDIGDYLVEIEARNNLNESAKQQFYLTVKKVDDISNHPSTKIILYPNPANSNLYFSGIKNQTKYQIFNIFGQLSLSGDINDSVIDISNLNYGCYSVKIWNNNVGQINYLFIKN